MSQLPETLNTAANRDGLVGVTLLTERAFAGSWPFGIVGSDEAGEPSPLESIATLRRPSLLEHGQGQTLTWRQR